MNHISVHSAIEWVYSEEDKLLAALSSLTEQTKLHDAQKLRMYRLKNA